MLKKTRGKNTFDQHKKKRDEGAGHTTERGSKLSEVDIKHYIIIKYKK